MVSPSRVFFCLFFGFFCEKEKKKSPLSFLLVFCFVLFFQGASRITWLIKRHGDGDRVSTEWAATKRPALILLPASMVQRGCPCPTTKQLRGICSSSKMKKEELAASLTLASCCLGKWSSEESKSSAQLYQIIMHLKIIEHY